MASEGELRRLLGKAAADKAFRAKLVARPEAAAQEMGVRLTASQASGIKGAKSAISMGGKASDLKIKQSAAKLLAIWI